MSPEALYRFIAAQISAWEGDWNELTDRQRERIGKRFRALLNKYPLATYDSGIIRTTGDNIRQVERIMRDLQPALWPKYTLQKWTGLERVVATLEDANQRYFRSLSNNFRDIPAYRKVTQEAADSALAALSAGSRKAMLEDPMRKAMTEYVTRGGDLAGMGNLIAISIGEIEKNLPRDILARELYTQLGQYRNLNHLATDTLFTYNRSYQQTIAGRAGLEWYKYLGGLIRGSRDFCKQRAGKYYHQDDIEAWGQKTWDGQIPATNKFNIYQRLGGYGCRHVLVPVPERAVPDEFKRKPLRVSESPR